MSLLYTVVRGALRLGLRAYFREIETHGEKNMPREGPLVIIANHHNGMIDPFLLMAATDRPVTFVAKATLFRVPILGWILRGLHCMPAYRGEEQDYAKEKNQALYAAAGEFLASGRAIGIFPEGRSHVDPTLVEFKHGVSRIAFDAAARGAPVRVQLVGIHFERNRGFRGKALLQFGPALAVDAWRDPYLQDPRAATAALTEELYKQLSAYVLTAENEELVRLADLIERMGVLDATGEADLKGAFERKKVLLEGYRTLCTVAPREVNAFRRSLRRYQEFLDALGVRDAEIAVDYRFTRVAGFALRNTLALILGLPFLLLGLVCNLIPYLVSYFSAQRGRSLDDRTSIGFMVAIVSFPIYWATLALASWHLARLPGVFATALLAPASGMLSLAWMDRWSRVLQATWGLWSALALPSARAKLRRMRGRIIKRLQRLIRRLDSSA